MVYRAVVPAVFAESVRARLGTSVGALGGLVDRLALGAIAIMLSRAGPGIGAMRQMMCCSIRTCAASAGRKPSASRCQTARGSAPVSAGAAAVGSVAAAPFAGAGQAASRLAKKAESAAESAVNKIADADEGTVNMLVKGGAMLANAALAGVRCSTQTPCRLR